MRGFRADGAVAIAELDDEERLVVARIVADVALLLGAEPFGSDHPGDSSPADIDIDDPFEHLRGLEESIKEPSDPAILRLLPNAAPTDREAADEFRRLTDGELRATKIRRLRRIWEQLSFGSNGASDEEWVVNEDEAFATAAALTDVRLVLASRLGLTTDDDADRLHQEIDLATHALETDEEEVLPIDHERVWLGMLYQALTWLQETLVEYVARPKETDV
ncbi:DUF2017 family protein [Demequina sp.]|uniref:DUF2017 family protein n=1 Tax=Demequina sp. TaxID=2050685 RepID=UPI003D09E11F